VGVASGPALCRGLQSWVGTASRVGQEALQKRRTCRARHTESSVLGPAGVTADAMRGCKESELSRELGGWA
jgi:hypothetical protein